MRLNNDNWEEKVGTERARYREMLCACMEMWNGSLCHSFNKSGYKRKSRELSCARWRYRTCNSNSGLQQSEKCKN
jgi:hypothetical protein